MSKIDSSPTGLKAAYSFEQLVVGPNNNVAVAACQEVIKGPGETYNPLFIYGPSGVGKTHLIQATASALLEKHKTFKVRYLSAERFTSDVVTALSEDRVLEVRKMYSSLDLLIVDDVQYLSESKVAQEELFHIFNNIHQENKQVILAADRPPNQLAGLNKNIRSRLEWGLATDIKVPDEPTRILILKKKQQSQGLSMTEPMLTYVARTLKSNVRELEGFLKRIHAYSTLSRQEVNMDLVKSVVKEILPEGAIVDESPVVETPPPHSSIEHPKTHKNGGHVKEKEKAPAQVEEETDVSQPAKESVPFDLMIESMSLTEEETPPAKTAPKAPEKAPEKAIEKPPIHQKKEVEKEPEVKTPPPKKAKVEEKPVEKPAPEPVPEPVAEAGPASEEGSPYGEEEGDLPSGHKEVNAVFFYPEGCEQALESVHQKFQDVIKKHKLKFRLRRVYAHAYSIKGKVNYTSFVDVCKGNKVPVAIVIGPPPEAMIPQQDFYDLLTVTLDVQGVSLQLVNWQEVNKDYRYLNLALDIALVRTK